MHLKPAHILAVGLKHPTPELVQIDIGEATLNFYCLYLPKLQAKFDASIVSCPDQHPTAEGSQVKLPQTLYHCANRFASVCKCPETTTLALNCWCQSSVSTVPHQGVKRGMARDVDKIIA